MLCRVLKCTYTPNLKLIHWNLDITRVLGSMFPDPRIVWGPRIELFFLNIWKKSLKIGPIIKELWPKMWNNASGVSDLSILSQSLQVEVWSHLLMCDHRITPLKWSIQRCNNTATGVISGDWHWMSCRVPDTATGVISGDWHWMSCRVPEDTNSHFWP